MIVSFDSAEKYLAATADMLEQREVENNLILGICNHLKDKNIQSDQFVFINSVTDGAIRATSIKTAGNAIISIPSPDISGLKELPDYYHHQNIRLEGVFGEHPPATAFATYYSRDYFNKISMIVHRLSDVIEIPEVSGSLKAAGYEDLELVLEWTGQFRKETESGNHSNPAEDLAMIKTRIADGTLYLWMDHEKAVSMAAMNRKTRHVGVIGYVYTPKGFRGKGYATTLVKTLSKKLLQSGFEYCSLFTDRANPTSNHIYRTIGYEPITEFSTIIFT